MLSAKEILRELRLLNLESEICWKSILVDLILDMPTYKN